jgi:SHOCT-like domain
MNDDRKSILEMLAAGKITAEEAERLLTALEPKPASPAADTPDAPPSASAPARTKTPKYLRVLVEADESTTGLRGGPTTVNVRVPMQLLRAGVRLAGLIPPQAHGQVDQAFSKHGIHIPLSQIKPENLEEIIDHLGDLTVDVDGKDDNKTRVRVFCE